MADLSYNEKRIVHEHIIHDGYVLGFSDRQFNDFMGDVAGIDITDKKYSDGNSGSKGNRLKRFIELEPDHLVGKVLTEFYDEIVRYNSQTGKIQSFDKYEPYHKIHRRLSGGSIVEHIDAIQASTDDKDFQQLAKLIRESIEKNIPEAALDRLHTFMFKFLKELCDSHNVSYTNDESLNAVYGKYIKAIRDKKFIESEMAEKIIQSTFSVMQSFNDIRNNKSFAHDNPILNHDESVLIFGYVTTTVKFIQSIEAKNKNEIVEKVKPDWGGF